MPRTVKKAVPSGKRQVRFSAHVLKVADAKGRVVLGPRAANRSLQVEETGVGEWTVRLVEPVPVTEAWLFKHPEALRRVHRGFQQAQKREFAADPKLGRDYSWLRDVDEEHV